MNKLLRFLGIIVLLMAMPMKHFGQQPQLIHNESTIDFDITEIANFDERIFFLYNLANDSRFNLVNSEQDGIFIISADPAFKGMDLQTTFLDFRKENSIRFSRMDKVQAAETAMEFKSLLPKEFVLSLMMDKYVQSRRNNLCAEADPFCTDNGMYQFPAGVNAGSGESGPYYSCLGSTPNPAWYYMRIGNPGSITIHMYSTPSVDIDFCCWGPFDDPVAPCPYGLTSPKVVSCSYSTASTENCQIPSSAQTGQYYILVITNYSNTTCNINFSKTGGSGTTDCDILPPLVENDGPYCIGETITLTGNAQSGATYSWTGPNGWTANGQTVTRPNCNMSMSGEYICTIHLNGQTNSASTRVQVYAQPTASFTATTVCQGAVTQFTNTSTTNPTNQSMTYQWDFGDGNTSNQQNPTHQYAAAGNYNVALTASCGNGACTNTKTQRVSVYPVPVADAGQDQTIVYNATATLRGNGGSDGLNYHWEPANKVVNPNAQNTQTVALQQTTTFTLTVTHPQGGCTSSDQVNVLVSGSNMTATANASPNSICLGETSQLQATAVGGTGNFTYSWTPTIGLSNPIIANPTASPTETTTYSCTVSDGMGSQTVTATVTVNHPEQEEVTQYICPGESYTFYGQEYSEENDYPYYTTTAQGCEKTIILHLRHYPSYTEPNSSNTTTAYICPGTSYNFHNQYFNSEGMHPVNLNTVHGCDSIVWLNLYVYPANDTIIVDPTICTSQTYNFHGTEYNHDGDVAYFDTIDSHGCLLVEKLVLSVGEYQMPPTQEEYQCYGYDETPSFYWKWTGQTYTQDTYDEIILPDPQGGCDIKYRLNLKFHQEFYHQETRTECNSYPWSVNGETYDRSGHYVAPFPIGGGANFNCDSTYVLDLTVNYDDISEKRVMNKCDQYEWQFGWNNESYLLTEPGDYTKTIDTHLGCDSIVTLKLQLDYTPSFPRIEGNSWVVGGSEFQYTIERYWIDAPGTHETEWFIKTPEGFNKWDLIPYDNGDKCYLYIYTYELDSIELCARTRSSGDCSCGGDEHSKWIHCSSYGTSEISQNCHADIYPNPNDGNMTLSFDNMFGDVAVKVYDMTGLLTDSFYIYNGYEKQTHQYHSAKLSSGVYVFILSSKEGTLTKKVIILD